MAKFEAHWPRGARARVIFEIQAYTGLRIGDVAKFGRQHLKQRTIAIDGQPVRRTIISIDSEKTCDARRAAAVAAAGDAGRRADGRPRLHRHPARDTLE